MPDDSSSHSSSRSSSQTAADESPIAIVGIGCRYADTRGPREFWEILRSGRNTVRDVPKHRVELGYDIDHFYDPRLRIPGKISSKKGGFLEHPELFDPAAFGIAPRDALTMEPQQRLMVEVTWDALEDAGIVPESIVGERVAVILGYMAEDYSRERMGVLGEAAAFRGHDVFTVGGMSHAVLSGRIAYLLGVTGPSFTIDTACSSSLIATHLACQSLRSGESKMALAGGVNVFLAPEGNIALSRSGMLSKSGACKAFDASADGFVRAEGAGVVLLRPLADALAEGNPIYAVIRGSGISTDGRDGGHMMAPGRHGQAQAMRDAYAQAGIDPAEIHYVETHGTGTMIGDPVEIAALAEVMSPGRPEDRPLLVASVKGNLGHTESASGVAGLIKAALSIQHRELPAQLHFETPSPAIPWDEIPIRVHAKHSDWPYPGPAKVGVNSFGISGTNAHVVLESAPAPARSSTKSSTPESTRATPRLLPISSHDANGLHSMIEAYRDALGEEDCADLDDLAHTLSLRRTHRAHRISVVATSTEAMRRELDAALENNPSASVQLGLATAVTPPKIVMIFPGQGAQWFGMGGDLLQQEPAFAASIDRIDAAYRRYVDWSLRECLEAGSASGEGGDRDWTRKLDVLQPVLIAMEIALADLWGSWGIRPDRVIGQSLGEIAAAHIAGSLCLEDVARLACHRGRVVAQVSGQGAMAVVALSLDAASQSIAQNEISGRVEIAGANSPTTTILSGDREAITEMVADFEASGLFARRLDVDFASHCFHMDALKEEFREAVESIRPGLAQIPFDSTVDDAAKSGDDLDADYWVRNLRQPVELVRGLGRSIEAGGEIVLEVSPHPTLVRSIDEIAKAVGADVKHIASLQRGQDDQQSLMTGLGELFVRGAPVDWNAIAPSGRVVPTPLYAYQRKRFWFADRNRTHLFRPVHPLLGMRSQSSIDPRLHSWDFVLDSDSAGFMQDYSIVRKAGAPAALFPELALAVGEAVWPGEPLSIQSLQFSQPLVLGESKRCRMQAVLRADGECAGELRISSRESDTDPWTLLAICDLQPASSAQLTRDSRRLIRDGNTPVSSDSHFSSLEKCGLLLGPKCRTLREIESEVAGESKEDGSRRTLVAHMMLPRLIESEWHAFQAHPAILEGCFQLLGTLLETPVGMRVRSLGRMSFLKSLGSECWCRVVPQSIETDCVCADLEFFDREGEWIGSIEGLEAEAMPMRRVSGGTASNSVHSIEWRKAESLAQPVPKEVLRWIVISSSATEASSLAAELQKQGASSLFCEKAEDLAGLVARWRSKPEMPWGLVLLDWPASSSETTRETASHRAFRVASWADAIRDHATSATEVWMATRGMHVPDGTRSSAPNLGQSIAREIESFASCAEMQQCRLFDADGTGEHAERLLLAGLMGSASLERQFLAIGSDLHVARLVEVEDSPLLGRARSRVTSVIAEDRNFKAIHTGREGLECLELVESPEPMFRKGEVIVEVSTAGLSQLDVMTGLGLARGFGKGSKDRRRSVGVDFSGTVCALDPSVSDFKMGDAVFGVHAGALARRISVPATSLARRPAFYDSVEGASLGFPFLAARYALEVVARLRAGERLLVLSAAGGIGQAMIQVARSVGAEVSVTASTEDRRHRLQELGARVVDLDMDVDGEPRLEFDVIVSSLAGQAMHSMLARLATGGRYIDLCPRNAFERPSLGLLDLGANRSVTAIDIAEMMQAEPTLVSALLEQTAEDARNARIQAVEASVFPATEADRALRFIAQNRHQGRVCLDLANASDVMIQAARRPGEELAGRGGFIVTGDESVARADLIAWLREHGADRIQEVAPSVETSDLGHATSAKGLACWIHVCSESQRPLDEIDRFLSADDCDRVLISVRSPGSDEKASDRAWEARLMVDRLLVHGSPGAVVGSANGRALCLSIAPDLKNSRVREIFSHVFLQEFVTGQFVIMDDVELRARLRDTPSPLLAELHSGNENRLRSHLLREEILSLAPAERRAALQRFVCDSLASVQGLSEEQRAALDLASPLDAIGLDSLMTMELFMGMGRDLKLEITADWFDAGPTLGQIASVLTERLEEAAASGDPL